MSADRIGRIHSADTIKKLREMNTGSKNPQAKIANVYRCATNTLIAQNVVLSEWAKLHGFSKSSLCSTAKADRDKPHHWKNNPHNHKGVYARYVQ